MKKLKNIMILLLCFCMITLNCNFVFAGSENNQDDEMVRTIENINELRDIYDIEPLNYNEQLNKTAKTHNQYMKLNNIYSSIEDISKTYYRGRYAWERASYNEYEGSYVFELLQKNKNNYLSAIYDLIENPYARYGVFDPLYTDMGMSKVEDYMTFLFGGSVRNSTKEFFYPYDGQEDIPVYFDNSYVIDPYDTINLKSENGYGIPITYTFYTSDAKINNFNNLKVRLINKNNGRDVPVKVITSLEDRNLTNTIMILPLEEYNYSSIYEVSIKCDFSFNNPVRFESGLIKRVYSINEKFEFKTTNNVITKSSRSFVSREDFVRELIKNSNFKIKNTLEPIFIDVNPESPNYKYIYTAYLNDIIKGYSDGLYRANSNINIEQAYTILIRSFEKQEGEIELSYKDKYMNFKDRNKISSYAKESIYKAIKIGILENDTTNINPKEYLTDRVYKNMLEKYTKALNKNNFIGDNYVY